MEVVKDRELLGTPLKTPNSIDRKVKCDWRKVSCTRTISSEAPKAQAMENVHRPSRKGVGNQGKGFRSAILVNSQMIWSGLTGNRKRVHSTQWTRNTTQNIPNPDNDKYHTRRAFVASAGMILIVLDYNALEMRLLAAAAGEKDMIQIFLDGKDIHMGNAELVFGIPYEDIKAAKKKKDAKQPLTAYDEKCLHARGAVKHISFGQPAV